MSAGFSIEEGVDGIAKAKEDFSVSTNVSASLTSAQEDANTMKVTST